MFLKSQKKYTNSSEDVIVMKDQLICSRPIEAKGKESPSNNRNNKLDSLLTDEQSQGKIDGDYQEI